MSKIDYSISLEKQHTWTIYQEAPSSALLEKYQIVADNSWYEEYSYTGLRAEVEAQKLFCLQITLYLYCRWSY